MTVDAKYVHTNLVARDWRRLSVFYQNVFGCEPIPPERDLVGESLARGTGVADAHLKGMHLVLPCAGNAKITLEIFEYATPIETPAPAANRIGFGHIAFAVRDVAAAREAVLSEGGTAVGTIEVVELPGGIEITWAYVRDPEGNIIELQHREEGGSGQVA